jgi:hypothetical protein
LQRDLVVRRGVLRLIAGAALVPVLASAAQPGSIAMGAMRPVDAFEWAYLADTVMGGVSEGQAALERGVLRLTGTVSTANRGGFIQARTALKSGLPDGTVGLRLNVRGNGERYFIHLRTTATLLPWQYYQAPFETTGDWRDVDVPLAAFAPSGRLLPRRVAPGSVRSFALVAFGRDYQADVSLAAFGSY